MTLMRLVAIVGMVCIRPYVLSTQSPVTIHNYYDDAGQLTKVVDSAGNVVEYVYDPAGNIMQVNRTTVAPGVLATFNFTPQRGAVGTAVTILGQNFSTTPTSNIVQFAGVNAAVVSASATTLVVLVPAGATTGALTLTVGGSNVTVGTFTVVAAPPAETPPTVTITSPAAGATLVSGQAVTVSVSVTSPNAISAVDFAVNGYWFANGVALAPYSHTFIVPYGVSSLSFGARATDTLGNMGVAAGVVVNVTSDPTTTVQGTVQDSASAPVTGASVAVKQNGLKGEYFFIGGTLTSMPDFTGLTPNLVRPAAGLDFRNPDAFFSADTFGLGVTQNFAARYTGKLRVPVNGAYTFTLGASTGARLYVNATLVAEVTNSGRYAEAISAAVMLTEGDATIEVQYFNGSLVPELQLSWSSPTGTGSLREVIAAARFTPSSDLYTGTSVSGGAFSITGVPVALGTVRALASASMQSGMAGDFAPIGGATTNVGAITLRKVLFSATSAGGFHTCGIDLSGKGYCWGGNQYGKLGAGDEADRDRPAPIAGSLSFRELSPSRFIATADNADPSYTCGVTTAQAGERSGLLLGNARIMASWETV
jgi:YD repeat-containing protein